MFSLKSPERIEAQLRKRLHNGRTPDEVGYDNDKSVAAHWFPREGQTGLFVVQGTVFHTKESLAGQLSFLANLAQSTGGLLPFLGLYAKPTRLETPFKPWEESCEYKGSEFFVAKRNELNELLPSDHKLPPIELIGDRYFGTEEYVAARARGAFLLATGSRAFHDLIAHAPVQLMTSDASNQAHGERVVRDLAQAKAALAETGDQQAYDEAKGNLMRVSDTGFSGAGIASDWPYSVPSRYSERVYAELMGVGEDRARELVQVDREHVTFLASLALGQQATAA